MISDDNGDDNDDNDDDDDDSGVFFMIVSFVLKDVECVMICASGILVTKCERELV